MVKFIDRVSINLSAGNGGHGCTSIHREKFKPLGGPDGGNGGDGGSIFLKVDPEIHTLLDFHFHPHHKAPNGKPGQGGNKTGSNGSDITLTVPPGTIVLTKEGKILADLVTPNQTFVAALGGTGGLGNAALASRARKAPGFALLGEPGEDRELVLELKTIADVGLVGYPSAGKSSLISVLSDAKPKIGDYPFTTLTPNLGVIKAGEVVFTMADVPGLIPGAAEGKGLGLEFLRHIERCAVLVHVVDTPIFEPNRDPVSDIKSLEKELANYKPTLAVDSKLSDLTNRPRIIVLNKTDNPDSKEIIDLASEKLAQFGWPIFQTSALTRSGLKELTFELAKIVKEYREKAEPEIDEVKQVIQLKPSIRSKKIADFVVTKDPIEEGVFHVTGDKVLRWVAQTNFDNDEAVGYLADRLAKIGVENALIKQGAKTGDEVNIGDMSFGFDPDIVSGVSIPRTGRGTDVRLEPNDRVRADERRQDRRVRRSSRFEDLKNNNEYL